MVIRPPAYAFAFGATQWIGRQKANSNSAGLSPSAAAASADDGFPAGAAFQGNLAAFT
jgi:hypothetical protein